MATIPIEVIVQDKEIPVPETNTEETAAGTPDTGVGLVDNNTTNGMNGIFGNSASAIILPAIFLTLALGTIIALFIRKQLRKGGSRISASKKEKLATITASAVLMITAAVLVGNLLIPATKAATSTEDGITFSEDKISITITRDGDSAEASVESIATITSTSDFGYKVLLSMAEEAETANLYLDGNTDSEYYIAPVEVGDEEETNIWGYSLEEDGEYSAVPLLVNAAIIAQGSEAVEGEEMTIYYGVKVNSDLPAGTYSGGEIEYDLRQTYSSFPSDLTTMQGMTSEICESVYTPNAFKADGVTIEDNVPTATLTDIRDNKTYTIAKLADGKCWMTQNLDLQKEDLLAGVILNSDNTNNPADGFELPDSQISGSNGWGSNEEAINTAHIYDLAGDGEAYQYCTSYDTGPGCVEYGDVMPSVQLGNLYNWYTATAGTGIYSLDSGEVASGSICPLGWRLTNGADEGEATDYSKLFYLYGVLESPTSSAEGNKMGDMIKAPFWFMPAGEYVYGVDSVGSSVILWSSMAYSTTYARDFPATMYNINPWRSDSKYHGLSVRCVAE